MTPEAPVPSPGKRRRRHAPEHRHPLLRRTGLILGVVGLVVLVGGGVAGFLLYRHLEGNITEVDAFAADVVGTDRPTKSSQPDEEKEPLNILIMGSDTREGQGGRLGSSAVDPGARSDTTMILHVAADRSRALVVNIPRDTIVQIPDCKSTSGSVYPTHRGRFNEAFSIGGPGCTIKTVEQLTGVYLDHFVVVDFRGFQGMVNALGGVKVCLDEAVYDPKSRLDLPAGVSTVDGDQALAFVRTRYTIGDGSDISRIDRQQAFLSSVIDKARSTGTLLNPTKLIPFLDAATESIVTDPKLASLNEMRKLAFEVRGIDPKNITFVTTPWLVNPEDPNTVVWDPDKVPELWDALTTDSVYPTPPPKPTVLDGKPLTTFPADVQLRVLNGSGVEGAATAASAELAAEGYAIVAISNAESSDFRSTVVRFDPELGSDAARTVAASLGAIRVERPGLGSVVEVVVGEDWPGVNPVVVKKPREPNEGLRTADEDICS